MELHWNESKTAESIKEARAICTHVTMDAEALCSSTVKKAKVTCIQTIKEAKATCACTIQEAKTACSMAIRDAKTWGAPRLSHSAGNMPKPSETWRDKSSERKAGAKSTFSPLSSCPTCQPSGAQRCAGGFLSHFDGAAPTSHPFTLSQLASPAPSCTSA